MKATAQQRADWLWKLHRWVWIGAGRRQCPDCGRILEFGERIPRDACPGSR